jgi:hypothetical protein
VFPNKYSLKIAINKKWPKNQSDLKEDEYESTTLVYCTKTNTMPLVRICLYTLPRMQGSWNNNDAEMPKIKVESSKGMDSKPSPNIKGFPQYYHRQGH